MVRRRFVIACILLLSGAMAAGAKTLKVLETLTPSPPKKPVEGYTVEGGGFRFRNKLCDIRAIPLTREERTAFFKSRHLEDPFAEIPDDQNFVFFKVRVENLQGEQNLSFSPQGTMFGNAIALDDIKVYQLFYHAEGGEAKLAAAGKTLFLRNLVLPAGFWIERLLVFQYDDLFSTKKMTLVMSNILLGREGLDVLFPFRATFRKEKIK